MIMRTALTTKLNTIFLKAFEIHRLNIFYISWRSGIYIVPLYKFENRHCSLSLLMTSRLTYLLSLAYMPKTRRGI